MASNVSSLREEKDETRLPTKDQLVKLAKRHDSLKSDMDQARGELGAVMKDAEETSNIHRAVFKLCRKLDNMDPDRRFSFLAHFDHYRETLELDRDGSLFEDAV